jgi:hypothetical protein
MHHLGIGTAHRGEEILAVTDTVIDLRTGEVLSAHDIVDAAGSWSSR